MPMPTPAKSATARTSVRDSRREAVIAAAKAVVDSAMPEIVADPDRDYGHVNMRALMNLRDALAALSGRR